LSEELQNGNAEETALSGEQASAEPPRDAEPTELEGGAGAQEESEPADAQEESEPADAQEES
jgi:hypothetical protein